MKIFLILLAIIYALFPYDLLPDLFLGWGWLDDAAVLYLLWRFVLSPGRPLWERQGHGQAQDRAHGRESGPGGRGEGSAPSGPEDPYAVLGVDRDATDEEIRKAYRALANRYHPDKVEHLGEEFRELAEKRFRKISEAYHALTGG
ncbi:MAG TPA: DnaJ domain-containing protein [Deltaproteobacteria bacterium]|nr:DnaJ domain-containing protein [Deltaproteobacteria bacterium]HOI07146.1 DnaJ domain-containing protein [Deltaproteobacteria bacterium]